MTTPAPNVGSTSSWGPPAAFTMPPGTPGAPGTPGPPGILQSTHISSNITVGPVAVDTSLTVQRPIMPSPMGAMASNSAVQQQIGVPYQSLPSMAAPPQGPWLQPSPQMGGVPRLPNLLYHAAFPGPFPSMACGIPPSVPGPDSQPPGIAPVGNTRLTPTPFAASVQPVVAGSSGTRMELHTSDEQTHVRDVRSQVSADVNEQSDAWTAHKTEAGVVYYYNTLTGESTYDKPPGFKGEPEKVSVQPVPVSMVNLPGTDWVLVSTSDGKKYYYNNKTKVSSWQIPNEVTELRKKQESDIPKENSTSVPNNNVLAEKGSTPINLNAPAINTGGRDAMALRSTSAQGSSSALDLIKKKLQEFGTPVTSSSGQVQPGIAASESNGSRAVEPTAKGQQSESSKDKPKDANGDRNMTDSSSDSEDADSGPTKEECIIQFKEMLKERGVAPFSKWEKELPKIVFDPRFKAIPSYSLRRSLFEHYVKTRVEEERKEKRAALKAAIEGFKKLLDEASEDIDHKTYYQTFRKKWGDDPRFLALDRKDREHLLNERIWCMLLDGASLGYSQKWQTIMQVLPFIGWKETAESLRSVRKPVISHGIKSDIE